MGVSYKKFVKNRMDEFNKDFSKFLNDNIESYFITNDLSGVTPTIEIKEYSTTRRTSFKPISKKGKD